MLMDIIRVSFPRHKTVRGLSFACFPGRNLIWKNRLVQLSRSRATAKTPRVDYGSGAPFTSSDRRGEATAAGLQSK